MGVKRRDWWAWCSLDNVLKGEEVVRRKRRVLERVGGVERAMKERRSKKNKK